MEHASYALLIYLAIINAAGYLLMFIDKQKAKKRKWRIPESTLLGVAMLGGSLGSLMGMYTFRHKTRHAKFVWGVPALLAAHICILGILIFSQMA